jgi:hypothetical protein
MQDSLTLTPKQIIEELDSLPNDGLKGILRRMVHQCLREKQFNDSLSKKKEEQWSGFRDYFFAELRPVYEQREELGTLYPSAMLERYKNAMTLAIRELMAESVVIEINSKGKIKTPQTLGQYDTNFQRALELDETGELFALDENGSLKYRTSDSIAKLGKRLGEEKEAAAQAKRMADLLASGKGHLLQPAAPAPKADDQQPKQDEKPKAEEPTVQQPIADQPSGIQLTGIKAIDDALIGLIDTARDLGSVDGKTPAGLTYAEHIANRIADLDVKTMNFFLNTLKVSLNNAASKAA